MLPTLLRKYSICFALLGALGFVPSAPAWAQLPNLTDQTLQRALEQQQQQNGSPFLLQEPARPSVQIYQPLAPERTLVAPNSRLETLYAARAGRSLTQFGYDVLGVPTPVLATQLGAVQENYVLGEGDEIVVVLRGQENSTYRQRVNRDGQIILPRLNPLAASGRAFGDFRGDVERQVAQAYISTNVFVSLGEVRQISVLITGEVRAPGLRILSALASPLDAILLSGGIAKTGSLRNVALIRGNQTIPIDLYSMLMQGVLPPISSLHVGDRIFVPPIRNTVGVAGSVKRPGIYELRNGQNGLDANALIQLAGGIEIPGNYRFSTARLEADGSTRLISIAQNAQIAPGEILFVDPSVDVSLERVTLAGAVRLAGVYPRTAASSVGRLIRNVDDLTLEAYAPFAVIVRRDPRLNVRTLQPFSLVRVMSGALDVPLQSDDVVYVFIRDEIRLLADAATREQEAHLGSEASAGTVSPDTRMQTRTQNQTQPQNGADAALGGAANVPASALPAGSPGAALMDGNGSPVPGPLGAPQTVGGTGPLGGAATPGAVTDLRLQAANQQVTSATAAINQAAQANQQFNLSSRALTAGQTQQVPTVEQISQRLGVSVQSLVRMSADHLVWVLEEVRDPGAYVAGEGTTLAEMLLTAGGVLRQADLSGIEVTSTAIDPQSGTSRTVRSVYKGELGDFQRVTLQPLDVVRLRPIFSDREDGRVTVLGQVRYPGTFDITRGERLSSLLERAGGMTAQAYAFGAVFTRARAAVAEREGNIRQAREITAQLATLTTTPAEAADRDRLTFLNTLAQQVRTEPVLGRITVTADPAVLRVKPELDIILEPGDTLYLPPRPSTVTVAGEVLNNGSFQYIPGMKIADYLTLSGGVTQGADSGRIFVVLPDGSAHPAQESWLSFSNSNLIPPGSTIVVPRDLRPFNLQQFLTAATQITGQLAVTAAALTVIGN